MPVRKLNIGAGLVWKMEGWEILDAQQGHYAHPWQHRGSVWAAPLPDAAFDIIYTSHTLEHVPHFKIEKCIAEINRMLKVGGILRISVPDLKKAALAYVHQDLDYFKNEDSIHPADHLGFGSMFLNQVLSPGHQTIAFDSTLHPLGSYGHTYNYDFEMLRILLGKWGFSDVVQSDYCLSGVEEMRKPYTIVSHDGESTYTYSRAQLLVAGNGGHHSGFDNKPVISLYVEARKIKSIPYELKKEFPYNRRSRLDTEVAWRLKGASFRICSAAVDSAHNLYRMLKSIWRRK